MNTRRVNSAAGVILAALQQSRTPAGIALALESAGLLMTPETANDMASTAAEAVRVAEESVTELRREHAENARLRERLAEYEQPASQGMAPELPETALGKVEEILLAHYDGLPRPDVAVGLLLTNLRAELIAEAQHAHNTASGPGVDESVDKLTRLLAPTQALREDEDPCHPCGCPKRFDRHAWGCPTLPEPGACEKCTDGPADWCPGCSTCRCETHNPGCVQAGNPR
ncbi:hypothetical protein ACFUTR_23620 [Streptomyces sp. NPDC057367]|uniref:hypothetical protein n=1 Tax=Streptomyces sp. NPDC057367 TaxID=3346108 RepID=UPI00363A19E7